MYERNIDVNMKYIMKSSAEFYLDIKMINKHMLRISMSLSSKLLMGGDTV